MAKPIADSAAATVKMNNANIWPKTSSKYTENIIKFILIANNNNSIEIKIKIKLASVKQIPQVPIKKRKVDINNPNNKSSGIMK